MIGVPGYRMLKWRMATLLLAVGMAMLACSQTPEGRLPVYPVKGKVTYKGAPSWGHS